MLDSGTWYVEGSDQAAPKVALWIDADLLEVSEDANESEIWSDRHVHDPIYDVL